MDPRDRNAAQDDEARRLFARMYGDLKRLAHANLYRNGGRDELQTTMLVHEAFVKLAASAKPLPADRAACFAYVGKVMRSVVLDTVRERQAAKRGGGVTPLALTTGIAGEVIEDGRLVAIDAALDELEKLAPELRTLVELRYFAGLTLPEVSEGLGRPLRSVERDWHKARAILRTLVDDAR